MNRKTRDKFASGTDQADLTTGNAVWQTAPAVYDKLNADFGPFDLNICADAVRARAPKWFGPGSPWLEDALVSEWHLHGRNGYCNPPYGAFVQRLLPVARAQAVLGVTTTLLLPMRVTKAFKLHILAGAAELFFCDQRLVFFEEGAPRISFDKKGRPRPDTAMFDSVVVRYKPRHIGGPRVGVWQAPKHVFPADIERARVRLQEKAA
jgi:hypothetical protein